MTDATNTLPATPPAGTPPAGTPPAAPAGPTWLPDADEATRGYIQNKGWAGPADVLTGYRNLETMLGADRAGRTVVLPTDENDAPGWRKVYERLGVPANATDYKLNPGEGGDAKFATAAATKMHELGIPLKAGQALVDWFNGSVSQSSQAQIAVEAAAFAADNAVLDKDWGAERGARTEFARRAAQQLGVKPETVAAIEKAGGFAETMKLFAKIGDMMKEHGAEGLSTPGSYGMTPEGAKSKKAQLMADRDFTKKASDPKSAEWAELARLDKIIVGG